MPSWIEAKFPAWVLGVQAPAAAAILWYLQAGHLYYRLFPALLAAGAILFSLPVLSGRLLAVAPVYYFGLISLLSSTTTTTSRPVMSFLFHPPEYFFLALLCMHAARSLGMPRGWGRALVVLGVCALFAAIDEFHQSFVPGRVADPLDWMLDVGGSLAGIFAYWALSVAGRWEKMMPFSAGKDTPCN